MKHVAIRQIESLYEHYYYLLTFKYALAHVHSKATFTINTFPLKLRFVDSET